MNQALELQKDRELFEAKQTRDALVQELRAAREQIEKQGSELEEARRESREREELLARTAGEKDQLANQLRSEEKARREEARRAKAEIEKMNEELRGALDLRDEEIQEAKKKAIEEFQESTEFEAAMFPYGRQTYRIGLYTPSFT